MSDQRDGNTTHPSTIEGIGAGLLWVVLQLLHNDHAQIKTRSPFDVVDNDEVDQDLAMDGEPINTDAFIDLCIK
jgi:hypothetical protein